MLGLALSLMNERGLFWSLSRATHLDRSELLAPTISTDTVLGRSLRGELASFGGQDERRAAKLVAEKPKKAEKWKKKHFCSVSESARTRGSDNLTQNTQMVGLLFLIRNPSIGLSCS